MNMPVAMEKFLSQLSDSGIFSEKKLEEVASKKAGFADGESLARDMVKSRLLTKFQAEQILGGRAKNLTMGKYQLLEKIGAGGMGQVYKAFHSSTERIVAIKVILAQGKIDPAGVKRFEREVKAAAKLVHSNIITVFDADQADGRIFMVMEYIKGNELGDILHKKGKLSIGEVVDYILQAARGLKYAHEQGVIHRDIKPGNILVDSTGNVKIVDLGLAKIETKGGEEELSKLTADLSIMGTVDFMSPEQAESTRDVDARTDIYSLGATLYYLLIGEAMFPGKTIVQKIVSLRESPVPTLGKQRSDVPPGLEIIFAKMVAKKVEDRYGSMAEVITALSMLGTETANTTNFDRSSVPQTMHGGLAIATSAPVHVGKLTGINLKAGTNEFFYSLVFNSKKKTLIGVLAGSGILAVLILIVIFLLKSNRKEETSTPTKEKIVVAEKKEKPTQGKEGLRNEEVKPKEDSVHPIKPLPDGDVKVVQKAVAKNLQKEVEEKEDLGKGIKLDMVLIPPGKFRMGSPDNESGRSNVENQHEVTLTKPYSLGKYEVTQEQWEAVMGNNPSSTKGAKFPVTDVSWHDCQDFIKKLNAKTQDGYRLPTEAEWEYACRAGTNTAYTFGDTITPQDANYGDSMKGKPVVVGSYKPNAFGIYDMHGNVWEWCEDGYGYYPAGSVTDPKGRINVNGETRVLRGGHFSDDDSGVRSSRRAGPPPSKRDHSSGFRLARTAGFKDAVAPTGTKPDSVEVLPVVGKLLVAPFTEALAKDGQKAVAKSLQKEVEEVEDLGKGIKLDMVLIPPGKFIMGSPANGMGQPGDKKGYEVTLTKPYYMGKHEVTQEQWEAVMGNKFTLKKGAKLPVAIVSWNDCQEFIKKLNAKTKGGYRLPTEAEWEYACRAGTNTPYSFGDKITPQDANYGESKLMEAVAVGSYKPNAFGLYDMHGNVWEWCEDWYENDPAGSVTGPKGPVQGKNRVLRGGAFDDQGFRANSSSRNNLPENRFNMVGFRLARTK